jgi:hypothetical protein
VEKMKQQVLAKYVLESALKIAEKIGKGDDYIITSILLYLAREEVSPIYELENIFVGYLATEEEILTKVRDLANIGLLEIYDGRMVTNGTTIVRLTPLGKEVGRILESEEMKNGYPITKKILAKIISKRLKQQKNLSLNESEIIEFYKKDLSAISNHNNKIESMIRNDQVSSHLMHVYASLI